MVQPEQVARPRRRRGHPSRSRDAFVSAGAILREERDRQELSLAYVAARINTSIPYLSEVERGLKCASASVLEEWAAVLGMDAAEVLCAFRVVPERAAAAFFDVDRMRAALAGGGQ